jgi:two-component sensor histidine kinase
MGLIVNELVTNALKIRISERDQGHRHGNAKKGPW